MTLDLSALHENMIVSKADSTATIRLYPRILETFEECVLQHGGVLHNVWMDQAIAVWIGKPSHYGPVMVQTAIHCVQRLKHLKKISIGSANFQVHVGLTAGEVTKGVFGDDEFKTVQLFGPAIGKGMTVAKVNDTHGTSVTCDANIRSSVEHKFHTKPIELLQDSSVVYEVIIGSARREDDIETRLATYRRAFDLYSQRYYREALKAFRGYTKQYGYDRSVERIQSIMTGE